MENTPLSDLDDSAVEYWESSLETECPPEVDPILWGTWGECDKLPSSDFRVQVQRGREGKNIGLGNGLTNINRYLYGTHRARYYLIGADSGVGKTTISDFMFILNAWEEAKRLGRKFSCFYCSFEISKTDKIARWVSYYVFIKFKLRLPSDYVLGRIEGKLLSKEHLKYVMIAYDTVMQLLKCVTLIDMMMHPTMIFNGIIEGHYEKYGIVHRTEVSEEDKKKGKKGYITGYTSNDPDPISMLFIDHYALATHEKGMDTKGTMDTLSKYAVVLRNMFGTTVVAIQQFSTDILSSNRAMFTKKTEGTIAPSRLDFGDSKATYRDADVVLGYIRPNKDLPTFMGYNLSTIDGLGDCMVAQYILKNRQGPSNKILPLFLDGSTGYVYDLPLEPGNVIAMQEWYDKANEIDELCKVYFPLKN